MVLGQKKGKMYKGQIIIKQRVYIPLESLINHHPKTSLVQQKKNDTNVCTSKKVGRTTSLNQFLTGVDA